MKSETIYRLDDDVEHKELEDKEEDEDEEEEEEEEF